jgi:glycosyltransferase involved in cell wall biosynthesis
MDTNAIESWLARMHRYALKTGHAVDWRFHVQFDEPGSLEISYPECAQLVIRSPCRLSEWCQFFWAFWKLCRKEKFDVVHIHADVMSAPYAAAARSAGIRRVIVHVHNADESIPVRSEFKRRILRELFRRVCLATADRIVGISNHTLDTFLSGRPRLKGRDFVHYYGVDATPFENASGDRLAFRRDLGLADDSIILLFFGRIVAEKNPVFVVDVLDAMRRSEPRTVALFVGKGAEQRTTFDHAKALGLEKYLYFLGWRNDVQEIMSCSDLFILPRPEHPMEGFGLAVVEAQLAGLPMLLSRGIPDDPLLAPSCYCRLPLAAGASEWAKAGLALLRGVTPLKDEVLAAFRKSPMELDWALKDLLRLYQ